MSTLLEVAHLGVNYRVDGCDLEAVHDVSFIIDSKEMMGLVGESGCGKSTVATALLGILPRNGWVSSGSVRFKESELTTLSPERYRRIQGAEIAMIFQDPLTSLNPTFTIGRQLVEVAASHPEVSPSTTSARRRRAIDLLREVGIPDAASRMDDYPHQFSGGMRQRIVIAMALMLEPALLVADEATSALDVTLQAQILELFNTIREQRGTSVLLVSHDLGMIAETCDRVRVMYGGRIVEEGDVRSLFTAPLHPYTRALLRSAPSYLRRDVRLRGIPGRVPALTDPPHGCRFSDRCEFHLERCDVCEPALSSVGERTVRCIRVIDGTIAESWHDTSETVIEKAGPERAIESGPVMFRAVSLATHFDATPTLWQRVARSALQPVRAVDGVDLELRRGEVLGLVGESGSGKTTLGQTILRLIPATSGQMTFDGIDLRSADRRLLRSLRRRMQMIFQDPTASLSPRMQVGRLLTEPYRIHRVPVAERYSVEQLFELVGLSPEHATKFPYQLSGGQARRVGIARALALKPELIVADEPTSGLDVSAAASVLTLMDDLRRELGLTYVLITHDLNVVGHIADRIAVMYLGHVVETGSADQILNDPVHPYTQALLAAVPHWDVAITGEQRMARAIPPGEVPSPRTPPPGCRFHTRCPIAAEICRVEVPVLEPLGADHTAACHFRIEARAQRKETHHHDQPSM